MRPVSRLLHFLDAIVGFRAGIPARWGSQWMTGLGGRIPAGTPAVHDGPAPAELAGIRRGSARGTSAVRPVVAVEGPAVGPGRGEIDDHRHVRCPRTRVAGCQDVHRTPRRATGRASIDSSTHSCRILTGPGRLPGMRHGRLGEVRRLSRRPALLAVGVPLRPLPGAGPSQAEPTPAGPARGRRPGPPGGGADRGERAASRPSSGPCPPAWRGSSRTSAACSSCTTTGGRAWPGSPRRRSVALSRSTGRSTA